MSITRNRELSQFGSFLYINDPTRAIGISTNQQTPYVGIGTTNPRSKLTVNGDVYITGVVTATSFSGNIVGTISTALYSNYSAVSGLSTVATGIGTTSNLRTSGIITASAFYIDGTPLVDAIYQTWFPGSGSSIYRLNGNVGIGTSVPSEKLSIIGNVSAARFISTVTTGTSPLQVLSNTVVTNLNADFLRGKLAPSGDIVGTTDTQNLTNKTLSSSIINNPIISSPTVSSAGIAFSGSTSGTTTLQASAVATGTLTLPSTTTTLVGRTTSDTLTNKTIAAGSNTITGLTNTNLSGAAGITNANLANSTISGISLGGTLASLTAGSYINYSSGTTYNGSTGITISVNAETTNIANTVVARNSSGDFNAGTIGCAYLNADFTITAADFNSTSDQNLKENINTIENPLDIVNSLRGVSFDWKLNGKKSYGVIAQELEQVLPDLVTTKDNKSVNYNGLVGVLLQAVKELSAEVEELKGKLI